MPLLPWRQAVPCGATGAEADGDESRHGLLRPFHLLQMTMPVSNLLERSGRHIEKKGAAQTHRDAVSRETTANSEHQSDRPEPVNGAPAGHESKRREQAEAEAPCAGNDARPGAPVAQGDAGGVTGRATSI